MPGQHRFCWTTQGPVLTPTKLLNGELKIMSSYLNAFHWFIVLYAMCIQQIIKIKLSNANETVGW